MSVARKEIRVGNKFILKNKLGEGSFGEVYAAICTETGKYVAVKLVK